MAQKKKVISLFSGCGGMDLGFEGGFRVMEESSGAASPVSGFVELPETSFETVFACDIKPSAKVAWETHFGRQGVFRDESIVDIVKRVKAGEASLPDVDVVTGGFPCQDFSVSGKRKGLSSEKSHLSVKDGESPSIESRGMLYYWMREVIALTSPKVFFAENVKGLVSLGDVKDVIANDFRDINGGYLVLDPQVLKAADYGVPQSRERVIFIGIRKDALLPGVLEKIESGDPAYSPYPVPSHNLVGGDFVPLTVAFRGLDEPDLSDDPDQKHHSKAKWYGKHCQGQSEVWLSRVGPTIRSEHHGNIEFRRLSEEHGGRNETEHHLPERRLTIRECARIQTFPDDFRFIQPKISGSEAYKLIGNAVPPLLAYHLARRIEELWPVYFGEG